MQLASDSPNRAQAVRIPAMAHKRGGLLAQIEADVVDDRVPLSSLLGGRPEYAGKGPWVEG
jgi:hypothetical protein